VLVLAVYVLTWVLSALFWRLYLGDCVFIMDGLLRYG